MLWPLHAIERRWLPWQTIVTVVTWSRNCKALSLSSTPGPRVYLSTPRHIHIYIFSADKFWDCLSLCEETIMNVYKSSFHKYEFWWWVRRELCSIRKYSELCLHCICLLFKLYASCPWNVRLPFHEYLEIKSFCLFGINY